MRKLSSLVPHCQSVMVNLDRSTGVSLRGAKQVESIPCEDRALGPVLGKDERFTICKRAIGQPWRPGAVHNLPVR
jgi:hypothetical protein